MRSLSWEFHLVVVGAAVVLAEDSGPLGPSARQAIGHHIANPLKNLRGKETELFCISITALVVVIAEPTSTA